MIKIKNKIKLARLVRRSNDWINKVLCYPVNMLERKLRFMKTKNTSIYKVKERWVLIQ